MAGRLQLLSVVLLLQLLQPGRPAVRQDRDIHHILSSNEYNRVYLANIRQPYEIISPQRLDTGRTLDISTRKQKIRHHGSHEHVQQLIIQLVLDGKNYRIRLLRNEVLVSTGIIIKHYEENNQQILTKITEHCYYHGLVIGDEWSSVAVSTCEGIQGVVHFHNQTFIIQPLVKDKHSTEHPHVVFKASALQHGQCGNGQGQWIPFQQLYQEELIKRNKFANAERNHHQTSASSPKLLRIAVVLDNSMYTDLGLSRQHLSHYGLDVANIMDLYYRQLGFEVALTYLELWNLHDHFSVNSQLRPLLTNFLHFKKSSLPQDGSFDTAFFVTGTDLNDSLGIAIPASICSDRAVAVVKSGKVFEPQQTAAIMSHMTGHILGIQHDQDGDCLCQDTFDCMMSTQLWSAGGFPSRKFSMCSRSDLHVSLNMGITSCLWGAPHANVDFKQTCGNKILERGEECDCGSAQECLSNDPCCDPTTCLLQPWAQCRSGPCCHHCLFMSSSHMCRPRQSECDIPEFCDGLSADCPLNLHIEDGHPCAQGMGYCRNGVCPTVHRQCQDIWGPGGKGGHEQCYQRFNPTGNFNGHCGKDKLTGSYAKCLHSDVLCGLLHCEGGGDSPIYGSDKGFSTTSVKANHIEYECKTVHGPAMMDIPHMGLVEDWTKCGHNKVCLHHSCVQLSSIPVLTCPSGDLAKICSGHGVCSPGGLCLCDHNWEGEDCSVRSNLTLLTAADPPRMDPVTDPMIPADSTLEVQVVAVNSWESHLRRSAWSGDSYTPAAAAVTGDGSGISSGLLITVLATVTAGLFLVTAVTFICYRRSYPLKHLAKAKMSHSGKHDRDSLCWKGGRSASGEEDSDIGNLPPSSSPAVVVVVNSSVLLPEKGILKNSTSQHVTMEHDNMTNSNGGSHRDEDNVGLYEDEDEDAEMCKLFHDDPADNLGHLQEPGSCHLVIPPPPPQAAQLALPDYYPSQALYGRFATVDSGGLVPHYQAYPPWQPQQVQLLAQHPIPTWRTALPPETLSPSQSRIVRLRNLTDYMQQLNSKSIIDLSPSPDEAHNQQVSPSTSTSEDVRSSETDTDRMYNQASHSDHSPVSLTSSSTQHTAAGPSFGSLSQYLLRRRQSGNTMPHADDACSKHKNWYSSGGQAYAEDSSHQNDLNMGFQEKTVASTDEVCLCDMPPPMNPINIRSLFSLGPAASSSSSRDSSNSSRDSNNTSLLSSSHTSPMDNNSHTRVCQQQEEEAMSCCHFVSQQEFDMFSLASSSYLDPYSQSELSRSQSSSPPSYSAVIRAGPNRIHLVPAGQLLEDGREIEGVQRELNRLLENLPRISAGSFERSPLHSNTAPGTPVGGLMSGATSNSSSSGKRLREDETLETPCIDRSLEEIPAHLPEERPPWSARAKRPISVAVQVPISDRNQPEDTLSPPRD